ncbi:hypothetical protein [Chitinimonas taiwanensis]|nr:hypothetical protein [Chitinimonas taiwanensis]
MLDPDTETPAVLGKTDALIAKHRGQGADPHVPVLTDLAADSALGDIPVLTDIEPIIGDELMFTPEEIRAEHRPAKPAEAPIAAAPIASPPTPTAKPAAPAEPSSIELLDLTPVAPSKPTAPAAAALPEFDFPELTLPTLKPAASPRPSPAPVTPPLPSGPLMPELALNFDFSPPPEDKPSAAPSPIPAAPPAPVPPSPAPQLAPASPVASLADDMLNELSIELPDEAFPVAMPSIDPAQLAQEVLASLRPEVEKLLRAEMARQVAGLHAEALKRTLGALQPQLDKLVRTRIDEALKQR